MTLTYEPESLLASSRANRNFATLVALLRFPNTPSTLSALYQHPITNTLRIFTQRRTYLRTLDADAGPNFSRVLRSVGAGFMYKKEDWTKWTTDRLWSWIVGEVSRCGLMGKGVPRELILEIAIEVVVCWNLGIFGMEEGGRVGGWEGGLLRGLLVLDRGSGSEGL